MQHEWYWIALGALLLIVVCQQVLLFMRQRDSRKREELFQIVTENAADMIALVDVKGRRIYNSPACTRILGYSAAELGETSAFEQIHPSLCLIRYSKRFPTPVSRASSTLKRTGIRSQYGSRCKRRGFEAGYRESRHHRAQTGRRATRTQPAS